MIASAFCGLLACTAALFAVGARTPGRSTGLDVYVACALGLAAAILGVAAIRARHWRQASTGETRPERVLDRNDWICMGVLLVIAALPRGVALRHSLWYDELWTVNFMTGGPAYAITHQTGYNNHLLNSLLGSLVLVTRRALGGGTARIGDDWLTLVRLPAFAFGTAAVPALYATARRPLGKSIALMASMLLALSPAAVDLSAQTRGYSAVILFTIWQSHALDTALRTASARNWLTWLACATLGAFAHLYLLFPVLTGAVVVLGVALLRLLRDHDRRGAREVIEPASLMYGSWALLTFVCYAGIVETMRSELQREAGTRPMARAHEILYPLIQSWLGVPKGSLLPALILFCSVVGIAGLVYACRRVPAIGAYLALMLTLPPLLVETVHPHFVYMRFFAFALPAFLILLACGMQGVGEAVAKLSAGRITAALSAGILCGLMVASTAPGLVQVLTLPKEDYRAAAARLASAQRSGIAVAAVGAGSEYLQSYGVRAFDPRSVQALIDYLRDHGQLLVLDTDLVVNIRTRVPETTLFLRLHGGRPIAILHGRFAGWTHRWLDGDADFKIYLLHATDLPPEFRTPGRASR